MGGGFEYPRQKEEANHQQEIKPDKAKPVSKGLYRGGMEPFRKVRHS